MTTNFPTGLDTFTTPSATSTLGGSTPTHTQLHTNEGDAIEALQAKVGITGSAVTSSLDYRVNALEDKVPQSGFVTLDTASTATAGTAINAAIAALPSNAGTIYIPAGTWTIDTSILINKNGIILRGVSNNSTVLRFDGATVTSAIKMADTTQRFVTIQDMRIESTSNGNGTAIDASYFVNANLRNLRIGSSGFTPNRGIDFNATGSYYNVVQDCRIHVSGTGSRCLSYANVSNSNVVRNCRLVGDNTNSVGVYIDSHAVQLDHVDMETDFLIGIDVASNGHDCLALAPYLEGGETGIRLAANVESFTCVGGVIIDNAMANITDNGAKDPAFINTRVQYEPYTSFTARSSAFPQSYPIQTSSDQPQDHGLLAWTVHPDGMTSGSLLTNGTVYLSKVYLRNQVTISNIVWWISTAGATPTAGQNQVGIYTSAGAQAVTPVTVDGSISSAGVVTTAVTPTVLPPGSYWVAFVFNAGTAPTLARGSGLSGGAWNAGLTAATYRYAVNGTSATALPASITPASNSNSGFAGPWAALS